MVKKVDVITVSWNGLEHLKTCVPAVFKQTFKDFRYIIVDNGSIDGSVGWLKKNYPKIKVIELKENTGFSGGCNAGLAVSAAQYVVTLNNDTKPDKDWLKELVKVADRYPRVGMVGSKMLFWGSNRINTIGLQLYKSGLTDDIKDGRNDKMFTICDGAGLWKREMLDDINLDNEYYDKEFFLYAEEADIGFRARLRGWDCRYAPKSLVYHRYSASSKRIPDLADYCGHRNSVWVIAKNMPTGIIIQNLHWILLVQIGALIKYILQGKGKMIFNAKLDALKGLPKMLKKRGIIQKNRLVSDDYIKNLMKNKLF